jgi:hypothetical protein
VVWLLRLWLLDRLIDARHAWRTLRRLVAPRRPG